ncbi:hypothetical protein M434DRAFT_395605, partial [Hypoxylon sp. CO27-5]
MSLPSNQLSVTVLAARILFVFYLLKFPINPIPHPILNHITLGIIVGQIGIARANKYNIR